MMATKVSMVGELRFTLEITLVIREEDRRKFLEGLVNSFDGIGSVEDVRDLVHMTSMCLYGNMQEEPIGCRTFD